MPEIHRRSPSSLANDLASTLPPWREPPTSEPESPSPWLNPSTSTSRAARTAEARTKAREEQRSASTTGHVNQMLGECDNLPFLFPSDPEHRDVTDDPETIKQRRFDWPNDLIARIKQVMGSSCDTPSPPEFKFEMTEEATKHNLAVLEKYEFQFGESPRRTARLTFGTRQGVSAARHATSGIWPAPIVESDGGDS